MQQHVGQFIVEGLRVLGGVKVIVRFAPVLPATGQSMHHLLRRFFRAGDDVAPRIADRVAIGIHLRHTRLAEVFAHHDIGGQLRPLLRNFRIVHLKNDRAIRIADTAGALLILNASQRVLAQFRKPAGNLHRGDPSEAKVWFCRIHRSHRARGE